MYHRQSFSRMSQTITAALVVLSIALLRPPVAAAQPAHCTTPLPDCGALGFPSPATKIIEQQVHTFAETATVGMDGCGRFTVAWWDNPVRCLRFA